MSDSLIEKGARLQKLDEKADKKEMTVREAGRLGGRAVAAKIGKAGYQKMGAKGGKATMEKYGPDHFRKAGRKGGEATRDSRGPDFYEEIGKKGGQRVKELIARGRAAQDA